MTITQFLEINYNDCSNPCYFVDIETDDVIYLNHMYKKKFQVYEDYIGKKCSDILSQTSGTCAKCRGDYLEKDIFTEHLVFSEVLNTHLRSYSTIIEAKGKKLLMTKFFLTARDEQRISANESFDEAMTSCLEILAMEDKNQSVLTLLELLGQFYSCELAYIYELNHENNVLERAFWWSADKTIQEDYPQDESGMLAFLNWLSEDKDMVNIESVEAIKDVDSKAYAFFKGFGIVNLTINKLFNTDGSLRGIVGMSNRTRPIYDDRLLKAVTHFVVERFNEASVTRALKNLNETDLLTGFFNRTKYAEKLAEFHDNPPKELGVVFVNLNGLRKTNEYLGFEIGDEQIRLTSQILKGYFSEQFFRISGDEFVCFVPDIQKEDFDSNVDKLYKKLKEENNESSFSIGHAWDTGHYSVSELVKYADTVMTINKQAFYFDNFSENDKLKNVVLQELLSSITDDEFMVYLQPQIQLSTGLVIGAEALIRKYDKKLKKMVFPDQFIPLYEKQSIIRHIDLFVVRRVCQLLSEWDLKGKSIPISVNLSRVTLMEHNIVETIRAILSEYKISPSMIIIEVTERVGLIENEVGAALVDQFKTEGFRLSLDDFGCAYSNIITLAQISVDEVKLDKSLIDHVLTNEKNRVIVKNILSMCHELKDTSSLAEGIETKEQAEYLHSVNCHIGQGYHYSRPMPCDEFFKKYLSASNSSE